MTARSPVRIAIIGGGISGLAAAHRLITTAPAGTVQVTIFEASDRAGGWIRTEEFAGRPVDFGPDSLLVRTPWATELCRELGIEDELVAPGGGGAFLWSRGQLRGLPGGILAGMPNGPMPFVKSGLMSPRGIARAALDLVLPANAPDGDESIGELIRRRLGGEALERVIDPLLGGVHAGNCDDLSLAATAPQIAAAAKASRSLLRGLRATAPPPPADPSAPPAPIFKGPKLGMERIVRALLAALDGQVELRLGATIESIESIESIEPCGAADGSEPPTDAERRKVVPGAATFRRSAGSGGAGGDDSAPSAGRIGVRVAGEPQPLEFDGVILAVPGPVAAQLVGPHAPAVVAPLTALKYASVAQTALAYDARTLPQLPPGTGFLVPRAEGKLMTACTLLDQKWPSRTEGGAGDGTVVIKCSTGRIDDARFQQLSDEELVAELHFELSGMIGLTASPVASRVFRVQDGLPQYAPGHLERMAAAAAAAETALPGLTLTGAAYRGTSVPVCIREGRAAADAQLARLAAAT